ncbi:unnamed protein product [Microthlaspi erraticum]|uniref:Uncharacterized protein n=1 Tax=Microthlaspi erraticum TaxID=1685480 RepID=A0A6D2HL99_9BRAS|nr:unnamed protein product [Microthlaspi erraticum]
MPLLHADCFGERLLRLQPHPSQLLYGYVGMRGTFCQWPFTGGPSLYLTRQVFRKISAPLEPELPTNELLQP